MNDKKDIKTKIDQEEEDELPYFLPSGALDLSSESSRKFKKHVSEAYIRCCHLDMRYSESKLILKREINPPRAMAHLSFRINGGLDMRFNNSSDFIREQENRIKRMKKLEEEKKQQEMKVDVPKEKKILYSILKDGSIDILKESPAVLSGFITFDEQNQILSDCLAII